MYERADKVSVQSSANGLVVGGYRKEFGHDCKCRASSIQQGRGKGAEAHLGSETAEVGPHSRTGEGKVMANSEPDDMLSAREENRLIKSGQRVLLEGGYPNTDRVGCPGVNVLKALAQRKADLRQSEQAVLHIGGCSPCFIEYTALHKQATKGKTVELVLASAALLILAVVGGWAWKTHWFHGFGGNVATNVPYQKVTVDLRNRLILRGDQVPSATSGPIQLPRGRLDLSILLPKGSGPGNYEVQVSTEFEKSLIAATGMAVNQNGIAMLNVKLDVSNLSPGGYLLAIGGAGHERREYPLVVK